MSSHHIAMIAPSNSYAFVSLWAQRQAKMAGAA
jgi:hypothetical protein